MKGELIVSVHIPKTGGSTFRALLSEVAGSNLILDYEDRPIWEAYPIRRIKNMPLDQKRFLQIERKLREGKKVVVHGHFLISKYTSVFPEAKRVVWLRDPVERLVSHYHYWKREPNMENKVCRRLINENLTLREFAQQPILRNIMTYFLDQQNIEGFDFIGITEKYSECLEHFKKRFGIPIAQKGIRIFKNPTRKVGERYLLSSSEREKIRLLNFEDFQLFQLGFRLAISEGPIP